MPTIEQNLKEWNQDYAWNEGGMNGLLIGEEQKVYGGGSYYQE